MFDALAKLLPNVEWQITDNDLTTLKILDGSDLAIPTQKQIDDCLAKLQEDYDKTETQKRNKKLELLERLGITEEEFGLLIS